MSKQSDPEAGKSDSTSLAESSSGLGASDSKNEGVVEVYGGSIQGLQSSYVRPPEGYAESHRDGRRRAWIALILFILLFVLICAHYAVVVVFAWNGKSEVKSIEVAFNTALPVISGLAGTAAAFYFRDRDRR